MAYDGIQYSARVDTTTERKLAAKVVDNILNSRTYFARVMGMGKPMAGKTYDYSVKIARGGQGQWITGLETLNSSAVNTYISLSYAQAAFEIPAVSIMLESFANTGPEATIDLDLSKLEEAKAEAVESVGGSFFGTGSANQCLGLEAIVDDGTNATTIGGQSRSTYSALNSYLLASSGTLTLAKMATVFDGASQPGMESEEPNIIVTTKSIWSLYEELLTPALRNNYDSLSVRGDSVNGISKRADLKATAGFSALTYRGIPMIKDAACTTGVMYFLNERYLEWRGRTMVPDKYKGMIEKVDLGTAKTFEGVASDMPSNANGFFYQKEMMMPNQAGMLARFYVIGQLMTKQPRAHGKLTGITGV